MGIFHIRKLLRQKHLTIRQRLTISNMLMLILPVVTAALIISAAALINWLWTLKDYQTGFARSEDFFLTCEGLTDDLTRLLENTGEDTASAELAERLTAKLDEENIRLLLLEDGTEVYSYGTERNRDASFLSAAAELGGNGNFSIDNRNLCARTVEIRGTEYGIYLYGTTRRPVYQGIRTLTIVAIIVLVLGLGLTVYLSNKFLSDFVFRHIAEPLESLSYGTRQIRDGNLEYRIQCGTDDEFAPVCENFNEMAVRLQEMVDLTRRQERNRKELMAGISHDLRSPLTAVGAYTDGLIDGVARTEEARMRYLTMIKRKTEEIIHLVSRLFMFSKMDLGEYPVYPERLRLDEEVREFIAALGPEYVEKGLVLQAGSLAPALVEADPEQLHCIFSNAAENSWKYRQAEHGTLSFDLTCSGDTARLTLTDDGPGVAEEALPKLFEVFFRSDPARKNPGTGSGLGLAICKKAVRQMKGTITAANAQPHGLILEICLPLISGETDRNVVPETSEAALQTQSTDETTEKGERETDG